MTRTQLEKRQDEITASQAELRTQIETLGATAPADRTPEQNERLQALEVERQSLAKAAEVVAADLAKAPPGKS